MDHHIDCPCLFRRLDREEQHDDQLLHELLRCIKALSTAEVSAPLIYEHSTSLPALILLHPLALSSPTEKQCGKQALRHHGAVPFRALADLLYSEKKPGEVNTRRLIIELIHSLLELYPTSPMVSSQSPSISSSIPMDKTFAPPRRPWDTDSASGSISSRESRPISISFDLPTGPPIRPLIPNGHAHVAGFIMSLLQPSPDSEDKGSHTKGNILPPAFELPPNKVDMHDFLAIASLPRVYKTYLMEISQVCHDYFWWVRSRFKVFLIPVLIVIHTLISPTGSCVMAKMASG